MSSSAGWRALVAIPILGILGFIAIIWWSKHREEQELYSNFSAYLTPSAEAAYQAEGLFSRLKIARDTAPTVRRLERTGWNFTIEELRIRQETYPEFVYEADLKTGFVRGCTFGAASSQGHCTDGAYFQPNTPAGKKIRRPLNVGLSVSLGETPHAVTILPALLSLGTSEDIRVRGLVRLDNTAIEVKSPEILVPNPISPEDQFHGVEIRDFSLGDTPVLYATKSWDFDVTYEMPVLLAPMFDDATRLTVVRLEGALRVDLRSFRAGYRVEGRMTVLNHEVGHGAVDYYPGDYASVSLRHLSFPVPFPGVCFNVGDALAEVDFKEQRLRLGGTMVMQSARSFSCGLRGSEMGLFTRQALVGMLDSARSYFNLPETILARAHFVADLDDRVLCGDATINGYSVLHSAFVADQEDLYVWAPKSFRTSDVSLDSFLSSSLRIGKDFMFSDWAFPRSTDWSCWNGDSGPKTNLFATILPEQESLIH